MIGKLYGECHRALLAWCTAMTRDPALAEDLVQEAFLRALKNAELLEKLQEKQRKAWLYRTVKNLYVDKIRHASFEAMMPQLPEEQQEADDFAASDMEMLLHLLPEDERLLFVMRYLQGYNSGELGKLFGLPPGTVRFKLTSARRRLREALREAE